ncbi:thiamine diphosphokinase [Abyssibius alkaniclasticus]|uniref:thiamine diphosphokinase n=1 Tax=Abyssibius alkaniclasticus TaxID=2881234 RepID=UPI0040588714
MKRYDRPVMLLGNGPVAPNALANIAARNLPIVAVDGGADAALRLGLKPDLIIGDLDSASSLDHWREAGVAVVQDTGQGTTDFEKAISRITAPRIFALGFTGARADHYLATMATLVRMHRPEIVLLDDTDLAFACPDALALELEAGSRVSLFPLQTVQARSSGLEWALDGLTLAPGGLLGTSNRAIGPVRIFGGRGLWVILPARALAANWPG